MPHGGLRSPPMRAQHLGICHLCGAQGKLSFEHVPPESAFNDQRILRSTFEQMLANENPDVFKGKQQQRGAGGYKLCEKCNSDTGAWYVPAFTSWARQAMRFVIGARGRPSLGYPYNLFPLRVLKQVICMFFSVNGTYFQKTHPDLVRFLLNKESRDLPPRVHVYAFYTFSNRSRASGVVAVAKGFGSANSSIHAFSEITFPPFGFVLTIDSTPPQPGFCDISTFSQFEYRDWRSGVTMKMPLMPIYTALPGDYRTREQTLLDVARNQTPPSV
jgi:hypothetical protein